jgi:hypothetical protein
VTRTKARGEAPGLSPLHPSTLNQHSRAKGGRLHRRVKPEKIIEIALH